MLYYHVNNLKYMLHLDKQHYYNLYLILLNNDCTFLLELCNIYILSIYAFFHFHHKDMDYHKILSSFRVENNHYLNEQMLNILLNIRDYFVLKIQNNFLFLYCIQDHPFVNLPNIILFLILVIQYHFQFYLVLIEIYH